MQTINSNTLPKISSVTTQDVKPLNKVVRAALTTISKKTQEISIARKNIDLETKKIEEINEMTVAVVATIALIVAFIFFATILTLPVGLPIPFSLLFSVYATTLLFFLSSIKEENPLSNEATEIQLKPLREKVANLESEVNEFESFVKEFEYLNNDQIPANISFNSEELKLHDLREFKQWLDSVKKQRLEEEEEEEGKKLILEKFLAAQ